LSNVVQTSSRRWRSSPFELIRTDATGSNCRDSLMLLGTHRCQARYMQRDTQRQDVCKTAYCCVARFV
jgi:hypothetical protein